MFGFLKIFVLLALQNVFVYCSIPALSVRKVDSNIIKRKRQDTLEMCRIFNAEKEKGNFNYPSNRHKRDLGVMFGKEDNDGFNFNQQGRRAKRDVGGLNDDAAQRLEDIVDRLYDDVTENGQKVTYRQRPITKTTPEVITFNPDGDFFKIRITDLNLKPYIADVVFSDNSLALRHCKRRQRVSASNRRFDFRPAILLSTSTSTTTHPPLPHKDGPPWPKIWPKSIIPYFIDPNTYDNDLAEAIVEALDQFHKKTCVRLERLRSKPIDKKSLQQSDWIYITNPNGIRQCVHSNEKIPNRGVQMVVFGYDCMSPGEIVHEIMHVLGFWHEHTRPDRDNNITINYQNIKSGYFKYFEVRKTNPLPQYAYDYQSIMHYPPRAFSKNGHNTIDTKNGEKIGQRVTLSSIDVDKISVVYGPGCVQRNSDYLLQTCPSVVRSSKKPAVLATEQEISDYFRNRIWDYGIINYKLRDAMEFSPHEKENILAVIEHIERETCIVFRNDDENDENDDYVEDQAETIIPGSKLSNHKLTTVEDEPLPGEIISLNNTEAASSSRKWTKWTAGDSRTTNTLSTPTIPEKNKGPYVTASTTYPPESSIPISVPPYTESDWTSPPYWQHWGNHSRRKRPRSGRRHASSTIVLARSAAPGCVCPPPGKSTDQMVLTLGMDCFNSVNDLLHVFVHVLGLDHQHNMHDRDEYLHIVWDNLPKDIQEDMSHKLPPAAAVGFPYDYHSVMHFPWLRIKDGSTTMMYPVWNDGWSMGHWQGLSATDVQKINSLYYSQCLHRKEEEDKEEGNK